MLQCGSNAENAMIHQLNPLAETCSIQPGGHGSCTGIRPFGDGIFATDCASGAIVVNAYSMAY
jgi:hypothetical protein